MAMSQGIYDPSTCPVEEELGDWVVVTQPDAGSPVDSVSSPAPRSPQANTDPDSGREGSSQLSCPDGEDLVEDGLDETDMGLRLGHTPLPPPMNRARDGRPTSGSKRAGSSLGDRSQDGGLSSYAGSVAGASEVTVQSKDEPSTPEAQNMNNSARGSDAEVQASVVQAARGSGAGSVVHRESGPCPELLECASSRSCSSRSLGESDVSEPGSPVDESATGHQQAGTGGSDKVDRGARLGDTIILDKSSKSRNSQRESSSNLANQFMSSTSLMERGRHASAKSTQSEVSFRSEKRSQNLLTRAQEFFRRSSQKTRNLPLDKSLPSKDAAQNFEAPPNQEGGGGESFMNDQDASSAAASDGKESLVIPVESTPLSCRPPRGSLGQGDTEEPKLSNFPRADNEKVELWLRDSDISRYRLDKLTLLLCLLSLVLYVLDVGTDLKLAVEFMQQGHPVYSLGTLGIFLATVFLNIIVGLFFYFIEWQRIQAKSCSSADGENNATDTAAGNIAMDSLPPLLERALKVDDSSNTDSRQVEDPSNFDSREVAEEDEGDEKDGLAEDGSDGDIDSGQELLMMGMSTNPAAYRDQADGGGAAAGEVEGWLWKVRITFTLLGLGPAWRILEAMWHGQRTLKSRLSVEELRYHYTRFRQDGVTLQLLQLLEGFLEAAPQLMWQLYIYIIMAQNRRTRSASLLPTSTVTYNTSGSTMDSSSASPSYSNLREHEDDEDDDVGTLQAITLSLSALSLAVATSLYQRALRKDSAGEMSWLAVGLYFTWRVFEVVPRVLCFALFASAVTLYVFLVMSAHWLVMFVWLMWQGPNIVAHQGSSDHASCPDTTDNKTGDQMERADGLADDKQEETHPANEAQPEGLNNSNLQSAEVDSKGSPPKGDAIGGRVDGDKGSADDKEGDTCPLNGVSPEEQTSGGLQSPDVAYEMESASMRMRCQSVLNALFLALLAYMMIFCHLNSKDGPSRVRATIFYIIFYAENLLMGVVWYCVGHDQGTWYHTAGFVAIMISPVFHFGLMALYYRFLHPRRETIRPCIGRVGEGEDGLQCILCVK